MSTFELLRTKNSQIAPALPTRAHTYTLAHAHAPTTTITTAITTNTSSVRSLFGDA